MNKVGLRSAARTREAPSLAVVGVDISKADFHAHLMDERGERKKSFPNSTVGFEQLDAWLRNRKAGEVHVCMEATGTYWEALALHLHESGRRVSVVNPVRIKAYANSELLRVKTDAADAALIARFCRAQQPEPWMPPPPEIRLLQAFSRHLSALKTTRAEYETRLQMPQHAEIVEHSLHELITAIGEEIAALERAIEDHVEQHPDLKKKRDLLRSIPGIGETTANTLLSECVRLEEFKSAKQLAAYAGLSPKTRQSGTSVRGKGGICKTGNARLRKALYFPAITAMQWNPTLAAFADRLRAAGKHPMAVVVAVMRKLLVLAYGVLKSGRPFSVEPVGA